MATNIPLIFYYAFIIPFFYERKHYEHLVICIIIHIMVLAFYFLLGIIDPGIIPKIDPEYDRANEIANIP